MLSQTKLAGSADCSNQEQPGTGSTSWAIWLCFLILIYLATTGNVFYELLILTQLRQLVIAMFCKLFATWLIVMIYCKLSDTKSVFSMIMRVIEYFIIPASTPNRNYLRLICVLSYIGPRLCIYIYAPSWTGA